MSNKLVQLKDGNDNVFPNQPIATTRLTFGTYGGNALLARCGNIVTFTNCADLTNIPRETFITIGVIPEGYRPIEELQSLITNDYTADFRILIYPGGTVKVYRSSAITVVNGAFSLSWITTNAFPS